MKIDPAKGDIARILNTHHDHPGYPEEKDIIACFHHGGRIKVSEVLSILRPAQGGVRPESGTEPGIKNIRLLVDLG